MQRLPVFTKFIIINLCRCLAKHEFLQLINFFLQFCTVMNSAQSMKVSLLHSRIFDILSSLMVKKCKSLSLTLFQYPPPPPQSHRKSLMVKTSEFNTDSAHFVKWYVFCRNLLKFFGGCLRLFLTFHFYDS